MIDRRDEETKRIWRKVMGPAHSILAVDPGETTGLAWCDAAVMTSGMKIDSRFVNHVEVGQIDGRVGEQVMKIFRGVNRVNVRLVVSEASDHFLLQGGRSLRKSALVPIRMSGGLDVMCTALRAQSNGRRPMVFVEQTPSQAKSVVTDAVLREYGFEISRARRHELDAVRHLILLIRRYGESKRRKQAFADELDLAFVGVESGMMESDDDRIKMREAALMEIARDGIARDGIANGGGHVEQADSS